jgi:hypothetical protein
MSTHDEVMRECRDKLARGAMLEDVIRALRDGGFSKVHSIKALVDLGQANMNDAKSIVHNSPTWADVRERDEAFHQKLED